MRQLNFIKNWILFTVLSFVTIDIFAQEAVELEPTFSAIKSFFLPALSGSILALISDAKKYWFTKQWDWKVFLKTKMVPFLITNVGAVVLYLLLSYVPWSKNIIEILAGSELAEVTAFGLIGLVQAIVDGLWKDRKTEPAQ